jgi:Na+-translocating ferredoxin:NAD+ oxidoreductase RnfC subunit
VCPAKRHLKQSIASYKKSVIAMNRAQAQKEAEEAKKLEEAKKAAEAKKEGGDDK